MRTLRVALAQINSTVGDLAGNAAKIVKAIEEARSQGADLVAFPEMALPGYPVEDLVLKPQFLRDNLKYLNEIITHTGGITAVVGLIDHSEDAYNAAAVIHNGVLVDVYHKIYLPNYGVFDEDRYFQVGDRCPVYVINGVNIGVNICEDIWYPTGPAYIQAAANAEVIVNINASPYFAGKILSRERMVATRASDTGVIVLYTNMVGGQDELVFDGASMVFDQNGVLLARGAQFEEDLLVLDLNLEGVFRSRLHEPRRRKEQSVRAETISTPRIEVSTANVSGDPKPPIEKREPRSLKGPVDEVYAALVVGTRDYIHKNRFSKVVIGLSGGIDSSLVAAIATDALGNENVVGVSMPSRYSSEGSLIDARILAENLGIQLMVLPIEGPHAAFIKALDAPFEGTEPNVAEENVQSRIRGTMIMALSNKFGWLVLTTGNKSEMAVGYATIYGDMAGGFAVIKDVPKTLVYELAKFRNSLGEHPVIPQSVLEKEPSAELRPNQRDADSLPPYEELDPILLAYVEEDRSYAEMLDMGFREEIVRRIIDMVDRNEYKRRQSPVGIKITPRAFGRDRRLPIVNRYKSY